MTISGGLVVALLLALSNTLARAASFDCKSAKAEQERFVCNNAALSRQDEAMAAAYRKHLGELSAKAQALVRESQRSWLAFWPRACSADPATVRLTSGELSCATGAYLERIAELQPRQVFKGLTIYTVSERRYAFEKAAGESLAKHQMDFPQIDVPPGTTVPTWVEPLNAWLARDRIAWRKSLDAQSDREARVRLERISADLAVVVQRTAYYGHGAAHPMNWLSRHYFLLSAGRELRASDLFRGSAWQEDLGRQVLGKLKADLGEFLQVSSLEDLIKLIQNPSGWELSPGQLELHFNPYDVAPYSQGFVTVVIPARDLQRHLTPLGQQLLASATAGR